MSEQTERNNALKGLLVPRAAIVIYKSNDHSAALEHWSIENGQLKDPSPINDKDISELLKAAKKARVKKIGEGSDLCGITNGDLFYVKGKRMIFQKPSGVYSLVFGEKSLPVKYWLPPIFFDYTGPQHSLSAYFFLGNLPDPKLILPAAMPNISENGHVCLGSAMKNHKYINKIDVMMSRITSGFYHSAFSEWRSKYVIAIMDLCKSMADSKESEEVKIKKFFSSKEIKEWQKLSRKKLRLQDIIGS